MSQSAAVFCGGKSVPWAALIPFDTWNISSHWIERIPYVVSQISDDGSSRPIEEILLNIPVKTRHRASADPRDKVYALGVILVVRKLAWVLLIEQVLLARGVANSVNVASVDFNACFAGFFAGFFAGTIILGNALR
jgi:hypothetical protein